MPRKVLGKGLSALLPARASAAARAPEEPGAEEIAAKSAPPAESFGTLQNLAVDSIQPNTEQPRTEFDEGRLRELSQSIRSNGLLQPITASPLGDGQYRIIAGERRWRAARLAGLTSIPAIVRSVEQQQSLELALIENIQREDLNSIEIAHAFQRLIDQHSLSHEQIAERTGKERPTISNFLRLLRLPPMVQDSVVRNEISSGHARAILALPEPEQQIEICRMIIDHELSVRATERLIKDLLHPPPPQPKPEKEARAETESSVPLDPNIKAALDEIASSLGTRVKLFAKSPTRGRLEIEYYSQEDLDRIYAVITRQ